MPLASALALHVRKYVASAALAALCVLAAATATCLTDSATAQFVSWITFPDLVADMVFPF
jgi:hypothetical protein